MDMWVDLFVWLNIIKTYHTAVAFLQIDCNLLNVDFKHIFLLFCFSFFFENMYCLLFESSLYVALIVIVHDICLQYTVYHFIQTTTMLRSLTS